MLMTVCVSRLLNASVLCAARQFRVCETLTMCACPYSCFRFVKSSHWFFCSAQCVKSLFCRVLPFLPAAVDSTSLPTSCCRWCNNKTTKFNFYLYATFDFIWPSCPARGCWQHSLKRKQTQISQLWPKCTDDSAVKSHWAAAKVVGSRRKWQRDSVFPVVLVEGVVQSCAGCRLTSIIPADTFEHNCEYWIQFNQTAFY